ncbi:MAG: DUF962 domain-containing protein, partial [Bacillota bacterium]
SWFSEYSESHQNPQNRLIHKICVPLIFLSVVGLLLQIPVHLGPLKLGEIFIAIALGWYFTLGPKPFAVMLGQLLICYIVLYALGQIFHTHLWLVLTAIFIAAWFGQFYGHKLEGKAPSFLKDLQFLLIGPLWIVKDIFFK